MARMNPGTPMLSTLPRDCVEEVLNYLDLATLKALRLSNCSLCTLCTGPCFKKHLRRQSLELTRSGFRSLRELVGHPELGAAVSSFKIMAIIYDQSPHMLVLKAWDKQEQISGRSGWRDPSIPTVSQADFSQAEADLAWLQAEQQRQDEVSYDEAIDELVFCLKNAQNLHAIELDAVLIQGPKTTITPDHGKTNWYPVWMRASRTYCITMEAITRSGVELKTLNVYHRTPRCSVPLYDISTNLEMLGPEKVSNAAKSLAQLSLSISKRVATGATDRPPRDPVACHEVAWYKKRGLFKQRVASLGGEYSDEDENFGGLAAFLKLTPGLKMLDIHLYNTAFEQPVGFHAMFDAVASEIRLPLLRKCSIGGITTSESALIQFLSNHPHITHLKLSHITLLRGGSWIPIFACLEQGMLSLEHLCLSMLHSNGRELLNLHPVWDDCPQELVENRRISIATVGRKIFTATEIRKGLRFRPTPTEPLQANIEAARYFTSDRMKYGLPWENPWPNKSLFNDYLRV